MGSFVGVNGSAHSRSTSDADLSSRAWKWGWSRMGLPGTIFHDLRRCAVMNLERAGVSRSVAKSFTGHKTDSVYERYAIVDSKAQEDGAEKLARLFEGQERRTVVPIREAAEG